MAARHPIYLTRDFVFSVIDSELDYSDGKMTKSFTTSGNSHSVSEFVLYMEHQLDEARRILSTKGSPECEDEALEVVRKATALGVRCMMQNGAPRRAGY